MKDLFEDFRVQDGPINGFHPRNILASEKHVAVCHCGWHQKKNCQLKPNSLAKKPLEEDTLLSSATRAPPSMACLSAVARRGTSLKVDFKHSIKQLPAVVPLWFKFRRLPTTVPMRVLSPGTATMVSTCGSVKT